MRCPGLWIAPSSPAVIEVARSSHGGGLAHGQESALLQGANQFAAAGEAQRAAQRTDR
jgi:hypothetical protein